MTKIPWLDAPQQRLLDARDQGRLGHALLLSGGAGIGKRRFARDLGAALLCPHSAETGQACGKCRACMLLASEGHPDFQVIEPEEPGKAIRIDAIRGMIERMSLATHYGGLRITLLDPADALNPFAANSLLKTLEEPPPQNLIVLISERPALLTATIRSRCQMLKLPRPSQEQALGWLSQQPEFEATPSAELEALLALADGAPLRALQLQQSQSHRERRRAQQELLDLSEGAVSPLSVAERWLKQSPSEPIHWLYQWLSDVTRLANGLATPRLEGLSGDALHRLARSVNLTGLYRLHDRVVQAFRAEQGNLNPQLQLEALLLEWRDLVGDKPVTRS